MTAVTAPQARRTPRLPWRRLAQFDWWLLGAVLLALGVGLMMIYSATQRNGTTWLAWDDLVVKQVVFAVIGLAAMALVTLTEYPILVAVWKWLYYPMLLLLFVIFLVGKTNLGATRWLTTGLFDIQPSELTKVVLILALAAYFQDHDVRKVRHLLVSFAMMAVPMVLVLLQPNLSTAILLMSIWLGMAFVAGMRPIHASVMALLSGPAVFAVLKLGLVKGYQLKRITAWLDPRSDPSHTGYQNIQTVIAVGNGQVYGAGFAHGLQTQGRWLPLPHTDNIFALVAEELGFVGGAAILCLLGFIIWRILRAAVQAQDRSGGLIVAGIASYLLVQTFVNVGVVLQMLPVTGLSLPFISYGGSSLLALFVALGLVQSVSVRRKSLEFGA